MTVLFADSLIGSGELLAGRVSTSGAVWSTNGTVTLTALGATAAFRYGKVDSVVLPDDYITFGGTALTSSGASAAYTVEFGLRDGSGATFTVGLRFFAGVYTVITTTSGVPGYTTIATFAGAAATVYDLRVVIAGGMFEAFLDGISVAPAAPNPAQPSSTPYMMLNRGTASTDWPYAQTIEYSSQSPPAFWQTLAGVNEIP